MAKTVAVATTLVRIRKQETPENDFTLLFQVNRSISLSLGNVLVAAMVHGLGQKILYIPKMKAAMALT